MVSIGGVIMVSFADHSPFMTSVRAAYAVGPAASRVFLSGSSVDDRIGLGANILRMSP